MCYGSGCEFEKSFSGDCGHRPSDGPAPCEFESREDYEEAIENLNDSKADYLYEQRKDRELFE